MASLVLGVAATVILGPAGLAVMGGQAAFLVGSVAGSLLFPPKLPDGPRLNDKSVQSSAYGQSIPRVYGTYRLGGNVIWSTDLIETAHEEGKGVPSQTTYTYSVSCAISICATTGADGVNRPITGVRKIWADGKLIYDFSTTNTGLQGYNGGGIFSRLVDSMSGPDFTLYTGTETQDPDPTIQAHIGDTPAYRGQAYIVFRDFQLEKYGNRIPNFTFEVVTDGEFTVPPPEVMGSGKESGAYDPNTGYLWTIANDVPSGQSTVYINDPLTKTVIGSVVLAFNAQSIAYVPAAAPEMWVARSAAAFNGDDIAIISAVGMSLNRYVEWTTAATLWPGRIAYNSLGQRVYIGSVNGVNKGAWYFDLTGNQIGSIAGHAGWVLQFVDMYQVGRMAILNFESRVEIVNTSSHSVEDIFTASWASGNQSLAYDNVRHKLLWTHDTELNIAKVIDVATRSIQEVTFSPALPNAINDVIYHPDLDMYVAMSSTNVLLINADTFQVERSIAQGVAANMLFVAEGLSDRVYAISNDNVARIFYLTDRIAPNDIPVADVITSESDLVGLSASDIDVTDIDEGCQGFAITRQGSSRSGIEQLMMAYQFDAVESGGKVKFVSRGGPSAATIGDEDLAVHEPGQDVPPALAITRTEETELPWRTNIKYINPIADYQPGIQESKRLGTNSKVEQTAELAVVMSDAKAKAVADAANYSPWVGRMQAKFSTFMKWEKLEPTDIVTIDGNTIRITKKTIRGNILDFEGAFDSGAIYANGAIGGESYPTSQTIQMISNTNLVLIDSKMLRDQDDDAGPYVAACGYPGHEWDGCVLFKSSDGGSSYSEALTLDTAAYIGTVTNAVGAFTQNVFDEGNTINVRMLNGTLSSTTELAVLNGSNAAVIGGNKVIQFKNAVLNGDGTYTLSGLLWGRKGSPTSGISAGESFVLLSASSLRRLPSSTAEIGLERHYKAVTFGKTLNSATAVAFTNTAQSLECLSPVILGGGRDASGNLTITAVRRTRIGGEWRDYADVPLGEASESYECEIWDSTYTTLKRTLTSSTLSFSYSAANQTTDFGGVQSTVYARVYQLSATVGRGDVLQGSI